MRAPKIFLLLFCPVFLALLISCGGKDQAPTELPEAGFVIQRLSHASFKLIADEPNSNLFYDWQLGDGNMQLGPSIEHRYGSAGAFDITLTISDELGESNSTTQRVHVRNSAPEVSFSPRYQGLTLTLSAVNTSDIDGNIASYHWSIQGNNYDGPEVSITLPEAGDLEATLQVTDDFGLSSELTQSFTVTGAANTPPEAILDTLIEKNFVRLLAASSFDADDERLSSHWLLEDGSEYHGDNIVHEFAAPGDYDITVTVDDGEAIDTVTQTVSIVEMEDPAKTYRKALFEASMELIRRCGYCHQNRKPYLLNFLDLDAVESELLEVIQLRSPYYVYSFPSEQNGFRHQGVIGGRAIDAGDKVTDQLPVWHELIKGMGEYLGLETPF